MKKKKICGIHPVCHSATEIEFYKQIMLDANRVLSTIHQENFNHLSFRKFLREFFSNKLNVTLSAEDQSVLSRIKKHHNEIVAGNILIAAKIAGKFATTLGCTKSEKDRIQDIREEALVGLVLATYSYKNPTIKFSTFCWNVITNYLLDYYKNNKNGMSSVNPDDADIVAKIWEYICNQTNRVTLDEACIALGIDLAVANVAMRSANRYMTFSEYTSNLSSDEKKQSLKLESIEPTVEDNEPVDPDIVLAVESAELTDIEREVFNESLVGQYGWKARLARKYINPKTNKPYTSTAIDYVLPIAVRKIKGNYMKILSQRKVA